MKKNTFKIYSHCDADGGIAAAIFSKFIMKKHGWHVDVEPVNHVSSKGEWHLQPLQWPCAILDFTLHPMLLSEKFFHNNKKTEAELGQSIPSCYWIDHHPTGSYFSFLTPENAKLYMPDVVSLWDINAISTPGLLRTHRRTLGLPDDLIRNYETLIDLAEIIDGALYATCEDAYNFSSKAVKLQTLFSCTHPAIDNSFLYKKLVKEMIKSSDVAHLFDSDPLFDAIIEYEEIEHLKQKTAYKKHTKMRGVVAFAEFLQPSEYKGLGRFLPYLYFPQAHYAIHLSPKGSTGVYSLSCGINPWNKPTDNVKHLGNYFSRNFAGGGHAFVAGGKITQETFYKLDELFDYLNA